MPGIASTSTANWEEKVQKAAVRIAVSPSFRAFFATEAAPEVWVKFISRWSEANLDAALLIVAEEESMQHDLHLQIQRKLKVNDARFLQQMQRAMLEEEHNPPTV